MFGVQVNTVVGVVFMGCATRQILFIFGAIPICVESYLEYYNVYIYIILYGMMQIEIN